MDSFSVKIKPQYVKQTDEVEVIDGRECRLHEVQKRMKLDYANLPEFTIITAPTGTGKSYAFPFPVLSSKKGLKDIDDPDDVRGLIVLPTNALISELTASFQKTYPQVVINQVTGPALDKYEVTGYERWKKAIEIVEHSDLIITNPDIINYAMHGGYHQWNWNNKTGETRFSRFLDAFNYLIFDEYHLYDEAQIANILTLVKLRQFFLPNARVKRGSERGIRFFFVSATPEVGLKSILDREEYEYEEIIEEIVEDGKEARSIHGMLEVEFVDSKNIKELIRAKILEMKTVISDHKILLILDKLRDVQELEKEFNLVFPTHSIYASTGYVSKIENHQEKIKAANIIIATNKAEVGVNYDVEYCIMQPGKCFQNFVQRFGRVSRGDINGKIVVYIEKKYSRLKRLFRGVNLISYYDFLDQMRDLMQGKRFYTERVPLYVGEYIWCITNRIRRHQEYDVGKYLARRLGETDFFKGKEAQRFYLMRDIHHKISGMMALALKKENVSQTHWDKEVENLGNRHPRTKEWAIWWKNYLDTYLTFRGGSKIVKIYDRVRNEEIDYSLDWILQHKVIEEVQTLQTEPYEVIRYTVGDLKERDKDIQYVVSTIPNMGTSGNNFLSYGDMFELEKVFEKSVIRIYEKVKKGVEEIDTIQVELTRLILQLAITFDRKRLTIVDIESDKTII